MNEHTSAREQKHILIVDDSEDMRYLLEQILEGAGYGVTIAENGFTALTQAKLHHPDLILMDLSLPGMSGLEAVEHLRQLNEFRDTPIIAVTAHVTPKEVEHTIAAACTAHVGKPFEKSDLLQHIARLLADRAPRMSGQATVS